MLSVILLILKLIGILLASIIGVILLVICLALLVPIRYRIYVSHDKKIYGKVRMHWLLHLICVKALYVDEKLTIKVKLFGITVYDSSRPRKEKKIKEKNLKRSKKKQQRQREKDSDKGSKKIKKEKESTEKQKKKISGIKDKKVRKRKNLNKEAEEKQLISEKYAEDSCEEKSNITETDLLEKQSGAEDNNKVKRDDQQEKGSEIRIEDKREQGIVEDAIEEKTEETDDSDDEFKLWSKIKKIIKKIIQFFISLFRLPAKIKEYIVSFISKIKGKILDINVMIQKIKKFISDEINKDGFFFTLKRILDLIKHLNPKKLQVNFEFGFEDPFTTGILLGGLSALIGFYGERVKLIPNFEEKVLKGDILAVGRVRLLKLLRIGIKVILYKNNRQLIKNIKTLKEEL